MDLRYYFDAVDFSKYNIEGDKNSLGSLLQKNMLRFSAESLKKINVAIIGLPFDEKTPNKGTSEAPDEIRKYLYALNNIDPKFKIIDFGNLKSVGGEKAIYYALRDIIDYLTEYGLTTILIGGGQDLSVGVTKAFKHKKYFQLSTIDPTIDLTISPKPFDSSNYISRILKEIPNIFQINFIGYQSYNVPQKVFLKIDELLFDTIRLGDLRKEIHKIEPILRDTDFLSFDISSVRHSDAPGYFNCSPNGLYSEEACQIARYAGICDKLKVFGLFEVNPRFDHYGQTSKLAAQIIWYFLDGFINRKNDFPSKLTNDYIQYNVEIEELDSPLKFYQNINTGRWWFEIITEEKESLLISCLESDYLAASKKEIPEKWLNFIRKTDKFLK